MTMVGAVVVEGAGVGALVLVTEAVVGLMDVGKLTGLPVGKLTGLPVDPAGGAVHRRVIPEPEEMKPLLQMQVDENRAEKELSGQTMHGDPA